MPCVPAQYSGYLELILAYGGTGKGKTCACVGQALRAMGHGFRVVFAQFIKRPGLAGEQKMLEQLLGENFRAGGLGFLRNAADFPLHQHKALELMQWAESRDWDFLVLDELLYALAKKLVDRHHVEPILAKCRGMQKHVAISGRFMPAWLEQEADMVTEMRPLKHHHDRGIQARAGIEF